VVSSRTALGRLAGTLLFALCLYLAPAAGADNGIAAQRAHARSVEARVNALGLQLEGVVQRWDGERSALEQVEARLRAADSQLRIARTNLRTANQSLERRLVRLYVSPPPDATDIIVGAKSLSDLINRLESTQTFTRQDRSIAAAAFRFRTEVSARKAALERQRRNRARLVAQLARERTQITSGIAAQKRLLASIHETISTLQAREAARQRRLAALERQRIAAEVAQARREAAARAVQPQPAVALPQPPAAPDPAPAPEPAPAPAPPAPSPAPAPAPPAPPPPPPTTHATAASIAARYLGVPYVWGGASPAGFDCSGLVMYVYAQLGVSLPHYTVAQWNATTPIATSDLQPGDLVFFDGLGHVGIYIGGGQFIHAPHTGTVVQIASLSGYWAAHLDGARRVR